MKPSSYYDRIVDVMEELVRMTVLMRPHAAQLVDRYSERKAAGQAQGLPAFEQVKAQLPMIWKQRQQEKVLDQLLKEAREKAPVTFAEDYRPADAK